MPTATAPRKTAKKTVTFHSKFLRYQLVREPHREIPLLKDGTVVGYHTTQKPLRYQFEWAPSPNPKARGRDGGDGDWVGVLTVTEGDDVLVDVPGWLAPDEEVGIERDAVAALKAHAMFGTDFWLQGHAPGTIYPRPKEFLRELMQAGASLDEAAVTAMLEQERSTHGRVDLIEAAQDALEAVQAGIAAIAEHQAAQGAEKAGK